ncbi:MAG: DUF3467 domain-containing protein [Planctomycetes bacterium]|nr:DUF3467 domain-containing protein [Planctomycetota bacterium]NOG53274.1 DUF3467 domain-containing protein [Planctomycetota bacterium]
MADTPNQAEQAQQPTTQDGRREVKLRIDETQMQSAYANTFRTDGSGDELIIDFGVNRSVPGRNDEMVFTVRQQVILNWRGAKRLALNLSNLIRQYEEHYGEIDANPRVRGNKNGPAATEE